MGKPNALSRWEDHIEGIEDDNKGVVVITLDKIRTTILITDEGDSLKHKIFNTTCLLSEADVQRLCKRNTICKEVMARLQTIWADFTCLRVTYYGWKSSKNTMTPQ